MLKIRLKRCGRKKLPTYRIVVVPSQSKRDGRAIEELGFYNPMTKKLIVNQERILVRLHQGAQPSTTVRNFLKKSGLPIK